jgi:hypothetical protein
MSTALTILKKIQAINLADAGAKSIEGTAAEYKTLLQEQLLHGKGSDGQDLKPGYLEDPYFKSRESAQRYLTWKKNNSPSEGRNPNAPNLYIVGHYHNSIDIKTEYSGIKSSSSAYFGLDIESKYKGKANILGGEYRTRYVKDLIRPKMLSNVRAYLK